LDDSPRFDLHGFIGQLKRRRVIRVGGVYAVAGFAIIQGANAVLEMAGAPDWIGRLVLALVVLGFPAALGLAWAFDVTPEGVVRTPPEPRPTGKRGVRAGRIAVVGAVALLALAGTAWFASDRVGPPELDAGTILVLPFHVAADPSLEYLREGMVELLAASLNGETGSRAVDPRTALVAWRRAVTREEDELPPERALQVARDVGAGQLLLGGAVGTPTALTLNAVLYDAAEGEVRTRVSRAGPADSLPAMVDGIVAQLLAREEGVPQHQLEALMTTSLPALRAYLEGRRNYRIGRFGEAAAQLEEALQQDSTFALAAIQLWLVTNWGNLTTEPGTEGRALRLAWAARERLSAPDRLFLEAIAGPRYPEPTPRPELRAAHERALDASPDRPEAFHILGRFHRWGVVRGEEGARERSEEYDRRALALDSTFAPSLFPVLRHAAVERDTATVHRLVNRYLAADSTSETADLFRWFAAAASGDEQAILEVRARIPSMHPTALGWIANQAMNIGLDLDGAEAALSALRASARSQRERFDQFEREIEFLGNRGRLREGRAVYDSTLRAAGPAPDSPLSGPEEDELRRAQLVVIPALYYGGDSTGIAAAVPVIERVYRGLARAEGSGIAMLGAGRLACYAGMARVAMGDAEGARPASATLHAAAAVEAPSAPGLPGWMATCAATIEAMVAVLHARPDARALAERADSLLALAEMPRRARNELQLVLARTFDALGDPAAGLHVLRRRDLINPAYFLATILREEGRLAARAGDREGAIRAYRHYLALRTEPDPELEAEVRAVREELAVLDRPGFAGDSDS
jgi:tetratricopeptide (TPR) repeat protein